MNMEEFSTLENYGYFFAQISYGPTYKNQFVEGNLDYPEEFQVTSVDERVEIYNSYDDSLYQSFIENAKNIFKKYNEEGLCNKDNKNLKMLDKNCDKNFDNITHGGYILIKNVLKMLLPKNIVFIIQMTLILIMKKMKKLKN